MKKILVVDNHPLILRLLENRFAKVGHQVRTANDGLAALDVLREFVPDIIFLDLVMPNIGGEQLCRIIRQEPRLAGIYIVILSATAAERECDPHRIGANACIAKGAFDKIKDHLDAALVEAALPRDQRHDLGVLGLDQVYQREITRELLTSRRHLEIILHNMVEGVLELNPALRIIYLNPAAAALFARAEYELLGRELFALLEPETVASIRAALAEMAVPGAKPRQTGPSKVRDRQVVFDFYQVEAGQSEAGTIIVRLQDVTVRQLAEENLHRTTDSLRQALADLHQAQEIMVRQEKLASIGTLASGVAHEILNPLNIISSIVQLLLMEKLPAAQREQLGEVMNQIRRATGITDNLRMFSHRSSGRVVAVDIHALFDKTALLVEHELKLDNIRLERDFAPNLPLIMVDDDQLAQVFLNLISNARAAMQDRPRRRIIVRTRPVDDGVTISFADTGHGIAKEHLAKVFDPFFTTKEPGEGTGLGLSLVYSMIENHSGTIEVSSEEGQGTEFFIYLPYHATMPEKEGVNHEQSRRGEENSSG